MRSQFRKEILSAGRKRAAERIEKTRARQKQEFLDEKRKREAFVAPDGGADRTNVCAQLGRPLRRQEVIRRLRLLNSRFMYEQSRNYPQQGGIYVNDPRLDPVTLREIGKRFVCGIPHNIVSEFDLQQMEDAKLPDPDVPLHWQKVPDLKQHIPGWRSILLRLAGEGWITLADIEKFFKISEGRSSQRWQQAVH